MANESSTASWSLILIFACVALGFTAAIAEYERIDASTERNHAEVLATACSTVEGRLEDLGKFLSDPRTRLITLTSPIGSNAYGRSDAVIAWNPGEEKGYLLSDTLPVLNSGEEYEIWAFRDSTDPLRLAAIDAKPGASVYPFKTWQGLVGKLRLEVTAGPRSPEKSPVFAGEID